MIAHLILSRRSTTRHCPPVCPGPAPTSPERNGAVLPLPGPGDQFAARMDDAVALGAALHHARQVDRLPFGHPNGCFQPAGLAHGAHNGGLAVHTFAGTFQKAPGFRVQSLAGQVIQRGPRDGQRRFQLMRQLSSQRLQILAVVGDTACSSFWLFRANSPNSSRSSLNGRVPGIDLFIHGLADSATQPLHPTVTDGWRNTRVRLRDQESGPA